MRSWGACSKDGAHGRDLLAPGAEAGASRPYLATLLGGGVRRFGLVDDGHKLIVSERDGEERVELHRLGREDEDLAESAPERVLALRSGLVPVPTGTPRLLSEEERMQLRALGYGEEPKPD
jgi:hypothetical protein